MFLKPLFFVFLYLDYINLSQGGCHVNLGSLYKYHLLRLLFLRFLFGRRALVRLPPSRTYCAIDRAK